MKQRQRLLLDYVQQLVDDGLPLATDLSCSVYPKLFIHMINDLADIKREMKEESNAARTR